MTMLQQHIYTYDYVQQQVVLNSHKSSLKLTPFMGMYNKDYIDTTVIYNNRN